MLNLEPSDRPNIEEVSANLVEQLKNINKKKKQSNKIFDVSKLKIDES